MLRGAHTVTLDAKGRLLVPAKVRAEVPCSEFIVTLDIHEPCLLGYPVSVWEGIEKAILDLPNVDKDVRALQRWLVGNATSVSLDAQGRLLIPRVLCDYARLQRDVIWVGLGQKFELWDELSWKQEGAHFKALDKTAQGEVWERVETVAHTSVMPIEAIEALKVIPEGDYVDATFGRGGHARAIANALTTGRLLVIDKDPEAILAAQSLKDSGLPIHIYHGSYKDLQKALTQCGFDLIDGILFDLGVSSPQLDNAERGFSFMKNGPLDMRMDTTRGQTAAEWLNSAGESDIAHALKVYGEERFATRIARKIVAVRQTKPFQTTQELVDVIEQAIPFKEKNKHFATRTFQAVRIVINQELEDLKIALTEAINALKSGGRLVVISFHSLEDRLVKQTLKEASMGEEPQGIIPYRGARPKGVIKLLGKLKATEAEVARNARSRSAILRVAEKC